MLFRSNWVARSSAFVLKMDEEDIISVEESESILKNMKKKESKTGDLKEIAGRHGHIAQLAIIFFKLRHSGMRQQQVSEA